MKCRVISALLCAALFVSLSACGGETTPVPPDASAQAAFAGEWISYAYLKDEKAVPFEDFNWSARYTLKPDGTCTCQAAGADKITAGTWKSAKDGSIKVKNSEGQAIYTFSTYGTDGSTVRVSAADGTGNVSLAARTDTPIGRAALKLREDALAAADTENESGERTFVAWCEYAVVDGVSYLDADEVVRVDASDTYARKLFGIDPEDVSDGYALYDGDPETFSYEISDSATFIVYLDGVRKGANLSGFATVVKNSGKILAKVTTTDQVVTAVEQIYIP